MKASLKPGKEVEGLCTSYLLDGAATLGDTMRCTELDSTAMHSIKTCQNLYGFDLSALAEIVLEYHLVFELLRQTQAFAYA